MLVSEAEARIAAIYRRFAAEFGAVPVPGAPGSRLPEGDELRYLWSVVEGGGDGPSEAD